MEENIGVLLHKLTKYQTLLSNTNSHQKRDVYSQKINSYSQKLNKIGVNQSNINQLGGLIGGIDPAARKEELRAKFNSISLKRPEIDINSGVQRLGSEATASISKLKEEIKENKEKIAALEKANKEKEEALEKLTKENQDLSSNYEELANDFEKAMADFLEYQKEVDESTGAAKTSNQQSVDQLMSSIQKITAENDLGEQSRQITASLTGEAAPKPEESVPPSGEEVAPKPEEAAPAGEEAVPKPEETPTPVELQPLFEE